ncbi:MAG: hypothetical protein HON83_08710 [Candidatus Marinimicrobia bacterium]|jgi:hypothetical protein|nr:hypothetical protein [Candidatus Neomarinimicrobiota bacterium]
MLKILSILLLIPTSVIATEGALVKDDSPWNFDVQYDYTSYNADSNPRLDTKTKGATLNLSLNKKIDKNLTLHGDFFKTNNSVSVPYDDTNIRELYVASSINNIAIKAGKRVFKIDKSKGVQDLGSTPLEDFLWRCNANLVIDFNKCIGLDSIHLESKLSKNYQIELLKTIDNHTLPLTKLKSDKVRLKHSSDTFDYHVTIEKKSLEGVNSTFFDRNYNNDYIEFSLEERVAKTELNQWYVKIKHDKNNSSNLSVPYLEYICSYGRVIPIGNILHSNSLTFGKVLKVNRLLVNANFSHKVSKHNTACLGQSPEVSKLNSITLILVVV